MAQVAGAVIVGLVVSTAVRELGPKLGLSESTSNLLGTVAGMYAGSQVYGMGSTQGSQDLATGAATSSQVGADIPGGYGGESMDIASAADASTLSMAGQTGPAAGTDITAGSAASRGAELGMQLGGAPQQAPVTLDPTAGQLQAPDATVGVPGRAPDAAPAATTDVKPDPGYLTQGMDTSGAFTDTGIRPMPDTSQQIIQSQGLVGRTPGGSGDTNWWERLFSNDRTMDMAMAAIQGSAEAYGDRQTLEYQAELEDERAAEWGEAYGDRVRSLNQAYPSGYRGP